MFNTASNLLTKSGLTVDQCNSLLAGHGKLANLGSAFIDVENKYGINAYFGMAQAVLETGWGVSAIAEQKNNLFGITAYDANPYGDASSYNSPADCVEYWGQFLKTNYLTVGGNYYVSTTPAGVARHWASDPNYASKIVNIMNLLSSKVSSSPTPVEPPKPPVAPAQDTYVVQAGDNMWTIAEKHGLSLSQLESLNPQAGHPAGNYNVLWSGDVLRVGSGTGQPSKVSQYVTVKGGDTLWSIAASHSLTLASIEELNPQIKNPSLIYPGQSVRVK